MKKLLLMLLLFASPVLGQYSYFGSTATPGGSTWFPNANYTYLNTTESFMYTASEGDIVDSLYWYQVSTNDECVILLYDMGDSSLVNVDSVNSGGSTGWMVVAVSWSLTASTKYSLAIESGAAGGVRTNFGIVGTYQYNATAGKTTMPNPWTNPPNLTGSVGLPIYAAYHNVPSVSGSDNTIKRGTVLRAGIILRRKG